MEGDDVAYAQQSFHRCLLYALRQLVGTLACICIHVHAEAESYSSHLHTDMSQSYNTNILASQLYQRTVPIAEVGATAPLSVARSTCVMVNLIGYVENVCKCMLRHAVGAIGRNVCHYDAVA